MKTFNRKPLTSLFWSAWLIILVIAQSTIAAVPCGLISQYRLTGTFIYDGKSQTKVACDGSGESAVGYDSVLEHATDEMRNGATGNRVLFAKFGEFVAAKTAPGR